MFHYQECSFIFVADDLEGLDTCEGLSNTSLESFVFFVYFSKLLLSVVLDDVVDIDLSGFKKCFGFVWVGVITDFDLFTLDFHLLWL